jgi:type II secretory pathway component GspD/PulD (secretin)
MRTFTARFMLATLAVALLLAPVSAGASDPSQKTLSFRFKGDTTSCVDILHQYFHVNIVDAAPDVRFVLDLHEATLDQWLRAVAAQYTPALTVSYDGSIYTLEQATAQPASTMELPPLRWASAIAVQKEASAALASLRASLVAVPERNVLLYVGPAASFDQARAIVASFDQSPTGSSNVVSSQWVTFQRIRPTRVPAFLKRRYGDSLAVSVMPEQAQGGIYISGPVDQVNSVVSMLKEIDSHKVRQITVSVQLYDVQPGNKSEQIGVQYGSNPAGTGTGTSSTFQPGVFLRPNLIPGVTSGIGAQITALINEGRGKLKQEARVTMTLDEDGLFGSASDNAYGANNSTSTGVGANGVSPQTPGTSSFGSAPSIGSQTGTTGSNGGSTTPASTGGTSQCGNMGAHQIQVGETDYITFAANGFTQSFQVQPIQSGVILDTEPDFVGDNGLMHLCTSAQWSQLIGYNNGQPSYSTKSATTDSYVHEGESLVFGGFVLDSDSSNTTKLPLLGDIPILGHLFRYDQHTTNQEQLVFIVTPTLQEF